MHNVPRLSKAVTQKITNIYYENPVIDSINKTNVS